MSISFYNQWRDEQGRFLAMPDMNTKNTSFLRTCALLKKMGLKNYLFPLTLYDPDLVGVDVYDLEENTPENENLRNKVQIEARTNVWYFLRECIRIYEQGGSPVPFKFDRGSCAMTWCFLNGIDYTSMQPRQAQPLSSKILTPGGWLTMGDMAVGSTIISPDNSQANVIGVYPLGVKEVFELILEDGRSTKCCKDHLWKVAFDQNTSEFEVISLEQILAVDGDVWVPVWDSSSHHILTKIISIHPVGKEEVQCIEVDHPDHLYITDDQIVTHNTGKTVCALSLSAWIIYSSGEEFQVGMMAKDNSLRQENVKRVKSFGENLPSWWIAEDKFKDRKNTEEIFYNALRTHYVTYVANADPRKADLQARGASPPMFHFDEFEFQVNIHVSYPTILASTGTARENAKKNGKPHSNIITTTAGDPTKPECKEAAKILDGAMAFSEQLYDVESREKLHEVVEASSPQKMILGVFSHLQLGYDNKWLRDKIVRNRMTPDQVMRDYLNQRVSIQEKPIIPKDTLAVINASHRDPTHFEYLSNGFVICWYLPKEEVKSAQFKDRSIIVGCDSSEMIGRDATTLVGVDPRDLSVVFTFRCSEGNINKVGSMIGQLLLTYPKMVWIPENKSSGTSLIDAVTLILRHEGQNPFTRIFNWLIQRRDEQEFAKYDIRDRSLLDTQVKRYFGIKTDKGKREQLYGTTLLSAAEKSAKLIRDRTLITELSSLTERNGRIDHEVGSHDDTVVAWLMAHWLIANGRHLHYYGISPGTIMSHIAAGQPEKSVLAAEQQRKLREKIVDLEESLRHQHDPSLRRLIEVDIGLMKSMLGTNAAETPTSADDFYRDPSKFVDQRAVDESRVKVNMQDLERSLKGLMGFA